MRFQSVSANGHSCRVETGYDFRGEFDYLEFAQCLKQFRWRLPHGYGAFYSAFFYRNITYYFDNAVLSLLSKGDTFGSSESTKRPFFSQIQL